MNIIAKKEVHYKGNTYVFVVYDDNTYEIFMKKDFYKSFPNQNSGNYGSINNSSMNEMMSIIENNQGEKVGFFEKIKIAVIWFFIIVFAIAYMGTKR